MSDRPKPDDLIFPPSKSMNGTNSHYEFCEIRGCRQSYAVCCNINKAIEENRLPTGSFLDCLKAHKEDQCVVKKMRKEEADAGVALYYVPRKENPFARPSEEAQKDAMKVKSGLSRFNNVWGGSSASSKSKSVSEPSAPAVKQRISPPTPPKKKDHFIQADFSTLVTEMVKDSVQPQKAEPVKPVEKPKIVETVKAPQISTSIKPLPGETPIQFARRRAELQSCSQL